MPAKDSSFFTFHYSLQRSCPFFTFTGFKPKAFDLPFFTFHYSFFTGIKLHPLVYKKLFIFHFSFFIVFRVTITENTQEAKTPH